MGNKLAIIGAGSMGTALALHLQKKGFEIMLWSPFKSEVEMINNKREHIEKLPGIIMPENIQATDELETALSSAEAVIMALPSHTLRSNLRLMAPYIKKNVNIACFSKGLEENTCLRMSEVISKELPGVIPVAMSGPCHAEELAAGIPTAYVAASDELSVARDVQDIFISSKFRVYTSKDIKGVELGGALKNVIALCAGISDGLGYGDNTKAALMTRGMAEITRLGIAMGASAETFSGLTGIGDLIVTCTSMHSRNRRAGILIGQGKSIDEAIREIKMVVEGIRTTRAVKILADQLKVDMPISQQAYKILYESKNPAKAVKELMTRDKKNEFE